MALGQIPNSQVKFPSFLQGTLAVCVLMLLLIFVEHGSTLTTKLDSLEFTIGHPNVITCRDSTLKSVQGENILKLYAESFREGRQLVRALCDRKEIRTEYADVHYTWGLPDQELRSDLQKGTYHLAFGRPHLFDDFSIQSVSDYFPIAGYSPYRAYLVSRTPLTRPVEDVLRSSRIAMLASMESRSGHILPMAYLNEVGLSPKELTVAYFDGHADLRNAFSEQRIDVFFSYWGSEDNERFPDAQVLEISGEISGTQWFFKGTGEADRLRCTLQKFLAAFARIAEDSYYQDIQIYKPC